MATIKFTYALKRFFPDLEDIEVNADKLPTILQKIDDKFPGIKQYILNERGALRKHVNIFVDGSLIKDRQHLSDRVQLNSEIFIMQALSGG